VELLGVRLVVYTFTEELAGVVRREGSSRKSGTSLERLVGHALVQRFFFI
jgi:hypothetical protein